MNSYLENGHAMKKGIISPLHIPYALMKGFLFPLELIGIQLATFALKAPISQKIQVDE